MRRALLIAALAAPAVALAQEAGVVTVVSSTVTGNDDRFINLEECAGVGPDGPVSLSWTVVLEAGDVAGGIFQVFASNKAAAITGTAGARICETNNPQTGIFTVKVLPEVDAISTQPTGTGDFDTAQFVAKLREEGATTEYNCTEGEPDKKITVCVEYHPGGSSGPRTGWAIGELTVSLRRAVPPPSVSAMPGEGALNVSWPAAPAPTGNLVETRFYRVIVRLPDGTVVHRSEDLTGRSVRIGGLDNNVPEPGYTIEVFGLSEAKNQSATPATTIGKPEPVADFWEYYSDVLGGREQGGCGSAGGSVGLLAVAGLLAALRRRK